jgi:hypothetical protein
MKIFRLSQDVNNNYDTYDSLVVIARNEEEARKIHPSEDTDTPVIAEKYSSWCGLSDVKVEYIGEAKDGSKKGVVVASFNAG